MCFSSAWIAPHKGGGLRGEGGEKKREGRKGERRSTREREREKSEEDNGKKRSRQKKRMISNSSG